MVSMETLRIATEDRIRFDPGGFAPADPPTRSLAEPHGSAPFARLARSRSLVVDPRGFAPADPPTRSLAEPHGSAPFARLARCRSLVVDPGGFAPADPPTRSLAEPHGSAPFARLARCRSLVVDPGGFAPADPPTRSLAEPHGSAPFARLARCRSLVVDPGASPPRTPRRAHSRSPTAPLRSRDSLAVARSWLIRGASPDPYNSCMRPLVIASANGHRFTNGGPRTCVEDAWERLVRGEDVLDALIAGVTIVELDPLDDSVGVGGLPNADGVVQLDAACMHGPLRRAGGIAASSHVREAARLARAVM